MNAPDDAVTETDEGTLLTIEVAAGSRRNLFPAGYNPWRTSIACHVTEPARKGRANAEVISLVAQSLDLPKTMIRIRSGSASPVKKVLVQGCSRADCIRKLRTQMEQKRIPY